MQIRYQITLFYTVIVTVILLLLCSSIYLFSFQNRTEQFQDRLERKATSTLDLLFKYHLADAVVRDLNETSPSSLVNKTILVYDSSLNRIFYYFEPAPDSQHRITRTFLKRAYAYHKIYFRIGDKNAVMLNTRFKGKTYITITAAYDQEKQEWLPKLRFMLVVSFFASISIVLITGYVFSLRLIKSISHLTNRINHISSVEFSQRLPTGHGKDELEQLAITINELLERLQASFDTQRRFIANASHELSTPLASIGSQIDVALQRDRSNDAYKEVLSSVNHDVKRLGALVKSLLEIAKISGAAQGLELQPVRVDELLMRLPRDMKKISPSFEVRLLFDELPEDEHALTTMGNEDLLFSAIKNIVHNACKYSGNHIAVVRLSFAEGKLIIHVSDEGPGIAADEHQRIFQPFYRSADINNSVGGSGLGLPLANHLIKLYRGSIDIQSNVGVGTTFTITLEAMDPELLQQHNKKSYSQG